MNNDTMPDVLTIQEVAKLLGVCSDTIRRAIRKGDLKAYRLSTKGHFRIRKEHIETYLRS